VIARGEGDLAATALRECVRMPKDGRSLAMHLDVVWCNYGDAFPSAEFFLNQVAIHLSKQPIGKLAASMIYNNTRTTLCR